MRIGLDASRTLTPNPTGTERYAWEITSRLLRLPEGQKNTWVVYTKRENFEVLKSNFKELSNVKIVKISNSYLWTQAGLACRTWVDKLDVLWIPAHTLPVFRRPGIRTIVTIHGLEYEWLPAYENPLQRWYLPLSTVYVAKSATKLIAVSEFTKSQIVKQIIINESKVKVIYEGFENQNLKFNNQNSIFTKYELKPKQYLLFVGTIQPRKNLVRLIEAFSRLKSELKLVICGKWGWQYDDIKVAPIKYGVEDRVVFTGYVNDTDRCTLLANAMFYLQPSITEGFGLPVLEAMAAGVPVISSNGGALKEILGNVQNSKFNFQSSGLLFDPYNVKDMASKIKIAIKDKKLRALLIENGKARIKDFSWDKAAVETYNLIVNIK